MKKPPKRLRKKIKQVEKDIKEERSLWSRIKQMPNEDTKFLKLLRKLTKKHKVKQVKVSKKTKKKANKLFWGIEPPKSK